MKLKIITHPVFSASQSMPKFAELIISGMKSRGHQVETLSAKPVTYRFPAPQRLKKWLGYIDQFLIFPIQILRELKKDPIDTVYIFADQALGPWVPLVAHRAHVIHVHDFMALRSSLGEYHQNPVSLTGRIYQKIIRFGFGCGKRFVSVSANSQADLHRFLPSIPDESVVIHNGLNYPFYPMPQDEALACALKANYILPSNGFLLHVGGNQWYKNRAGVLAIYEAYTKAVDNPLPLLMMGAKPTQRLLEDANNICPMGSVKFIIGAPTKVICAAYSTASAFIFPSIAEGFGWPIIEAMSCGCPVLTTGAAPMTEVGGSAAVYLPKISDYQSNHEWATESARQILSVLARTPEEKNISRKSSVEHAKKFDANISLDGYESSYKKALEAYNIKICN